MFCADDGQSCGAFDNQPFSPGSGLIAGEATATHPAGNPVTNTFVGSFDFESATGAAQPGLRITVSPFAVQFSRQSFIRIEDNGAGFDLLFLETRDNDLVNNPNTGFVFTTIATGLAYDQVHRLSFEITFADGIIDDGNGVLNGNDIVEIYLNQQLIYTGTTWESYYQTTNEGQTPPTVRAIDALLFRISGDAVPANAGNGLFIDNVFINDETDRLILPESRPVPTLDKLGLVLMVLMLGLVAFVVVRRRAES